MKTAMSLLTFVCLVSCQPNEERPASPETGDPGKPAGDTGAPGAIDVSRPDTLLGQPLPAVEAACEAAGLPCRVVEIDGKPLPVTLDFMPERLNFRVNNGKITAVTKG